MPAMRPPLRSRLAGDELGLADRRELGRPVGAVRGAALDEHGLLDAVAAADVGEQLGEAVRQHAARWPEVMVRIDDALVGVDHVFDDERPPLVRAGPRLRRAHGVWLWHAAVPHSLGITPVVRNVVIWLRSLALPRP